MIPARPSILATSHFMSKDIAFLRVLIIPPGGCGHLSDGPDEKARGGG